MMGKKPGLVIAIGQKMDGEKMGEYENDDMGEMYEEVAQEFMKAVESKDKSSMWEAFKMMFEMAQHEYEMMGDNPGYHDKG